MKNDSYKIISLILFFLTTLTSLNAQRIDSLLNVLNENYPQEKIYLQMDKSYYNPGETIWFKAYLKADNLPAPISKTCYVELLDEKGILLQRKMMPILESTAASNFDIPDTVQFNKLFIRAYTSWMLNFDSSLFYIQLINIINLKPAVKKLPVTPVYSLTMFPEGGDLIVGISSDVAFKANDQDGTPVEISGAIVDEKGTKITSFSSVHDGMGFFSLLPVVNEKYKAVWKDKNGMQHETIVPDAQKRGIALSVIYSDNQLQYTLTRSENRGAPVIYYVVAQMQQRQVYGVKIDLTNQRRVTVPIETDSLPDGILQLTVFNTVQMPVAERIVFINNNTYHFGTSIQLAEKNLAKRGHNVLKIDVSSGLLTNLSVAVTDADINPVASNEANIFTHLLLTSDLKGYVFTPAYYFSSDADSVKQNLDLVMMTNGWRRFKWENILQEKWPVISIQRQNFLAIKGKVMGLSKLQLTDKTISGILKSKTGITQILNIPVDENGEFNTDSLYFFDTSILHYQFNDDKNKKLTTSAIFSFNNSFVKSPDLPLTIFSSLYTSLGTDSAGLLRSNSLAKQMMSQAEKNKIKTLSTVTLKIKQKSQKQKMDEEYTSGFFRGGDANTFITEGDPFANSSTTVLSYLQSKVAGLIISTIGEGSANWRGNEASFFVDETYTFISILQTIPMSDVAMIKVFRPPFFGAAGGGAGGAVAVYLKRGASAYSNITGLNNTKIAGYSVIKQFYSPDYETTNDIEEGDYRTTLYWNPYILLDKDNPTITIPFYNSDNSKKIHVIIEGINELGQLTREEKVFE